MKRGNKKKTQDFMDNNSTVHRNFGFLSNAAFSMEGRNGNMESSPHFHYDSKDSGGSSEDRVNQVAVVGGSDANKGGQIISSLSNNGNHASTAGGFCSNKGSQLMMAGDLCSEKGNLAEMAGDSCVDNRNQPDMAAGGICSSKENQVTMARVSSAIKGSQAAIAVMPLNVAGPEDSAWSSASCANGIISVVSGKGQMQASYTGSMGGSGNSGDNMIGLELGKRTYFEAPGGSGSINTSQGPNQALPKRPRASAQTPKCQVEGCKADLSSAKEYHRRHKVCALHSKATQVIVSGHEQRFCQQCSRFHGLSEFDEGKRSCRRRLAGHNERRRKPQPDPLAFNPRFLPSFQDSRKLGHLYTDRSSFLAHPRILGVSGLWDEGNIIQKGAWSQRMLDQSSFENTMAGSTGAERQLFLTALQYSNDRSPLFPPQSPKGMIPASTDVSGPKTHQYFQGSVDPLGQSLSLASSSSSGVGVLSGLEAIPICQGFTRVSDSGRALSLQSNMQLSSSTLASVAASMDMTTNASMMSNQNLYSNHIPLAQPLGQGGQQQHHYEWMSDKLVSTGSSFNTDSSAASAAYSAHSSTIEKNHLERSFTPSMNGVAGSYECLPLYSMLQGEVRLGTMAQDVKPTIDLMQMASASSNHTSQSLVSSGAYEMGISAFGDLQAIGSYDSSMFGAQQL